jgi:PAS domain S-box-containing protein
MNQTDTNRAAVIRSHEDGILRLSNVVTGSDLPDDPDLVGMDVTPFRHVCQRILNGEDVIIDEAHPLPADADAERRMYETRGLNATVIVPVMAGGSLAAAIVLDVVGRQHTWTQEQVEHARLTGQVMLQAIQRASALGESQRQAAAAAAREEQLRLLADGLPALIAYIDADQRVVFSNKRMCDWLGVPADTVHGRPIRSVLGKRGYEATHVAVEQALAGVSAGFATDLPRGDGAIRHVAGTCVPHRDGTGRIAGCFALVQDVTEGVRTDEELRRQRAELAHVARVVTVGQLSTTIAHELNQPLAAIVSNAQAAQRFLTGPNQDEAEVQEALTEIAEDGKRAGTIIHQMRALLRKEDLARGDVDVNRVVRDVLRLLEPDLAAKGVMVHTDLDRSLPIVLGNPVQLQQVVLNLANNAAEAVQSGNGARKLTVTTVARNDTMVELEVRDTGPGLPEGRSEDLFEPFFTTSENGMGMGLSITKTIIEAHGGRISAANADSGGAIFRVALPAVTASP